MKSGENERRRCQTATVTLATVCLPSSPVATAALRGASHAGTCGCVRVQAHAKVGEVGVLILAPFKSPRRVAVFFSFSASRRHGRRLKLRDPNGS